MTALEFVKSQENEESLMLVIDDLPAKKIMAAWMLYDTAETLAPKLDRSSKKTDTIPGVLTEMWGAMTVDLERLSRLAGVPFQIACETFERLKEARLLYPDCSIPSGARRLLRSEINAYRLNLIPSGLRQASMSAKAANTKPE